MLAWIMVVVVLLIIGIFLITQNDGYNMLDFWGVLSVCVSLIILLIVLLVSQSAMAGMNVFIQQEFYLQTHIAENIVEDASLTGKKLELNDWLYQAQWSREYYGMFSLYPDKVMSLEPIQ